MIKSLKIFFLASAALIASSATAQQDQPPHLDKSTSLGFEYEVFAGINIGGAAPVPLPAEIRKIESYNPNLNPQIGTKITKWFTPQADRSWGVSVGLMLDTKGMKTKAKVKNYGMEIIRDGSYVSGNWTGKVETRYHSNQLIIPILANYRFNRIWKVSLGPYVAYAFNNDFNGEVYDGYLREGDPTGEKVTFEGDAKATYDFGDNLRPFQWGAQLGGSWTALRHLTVNANLSWGLNGIFKSSFKTVRFSLYPIYLNLGFGYVF